MKNLPLEYIPFVFPSKLVDYQRCGRGILRVSVAFGAANADTSIDINGLGRVPVMYLVIRNNSTAVVYDGTNFGTDWTATTIVLRASNICTVTLFIN
jgi:hypothetical protein